MFVGSHEAAEWSAIIYLFFSDCKQHLVTAKVWLPDVLNRYLQLRGVVSEVMEGENLDALRELRLTQVEQMGHFLTHKKELANHF